MGEKKLYLYLNDAEYGRKFQRYLSSNRHPMLKVETVTEKDVFWRSRQHGIGQNEYWLTDDITGAADDRCDPGSLIVLDDHTDETGRRVSCRMKAENLFTVILSMMALQIEARGDKQAPMQGVYGVYAPWGEEGSVFAALLSQRLAGFGRTMYVNMSEFPVFYEADANKDAHLGELFFRIDSPDFTGVIMRAGQKFGLSERLPGVTHFRDLWDIDSKDMDRFFKRLISECGIRYAVVLLNDVREAMSAADIVNGLYFVRRKSDQTDPMERWAGYAKTENSEGQVRTVIMPERWQTWISDLEKTEPQYWLDDEEKTEFMDGVLNESGRGE